MRTLPTSLSGKTALITGAGRKNGIGAAIAHALGSAGANIFLTFYSPYDEENSSLHNESEPEQVRAELRRMGVRTAALDIDLGKESAAETLFDAAEAALGPIDILINNAAHDDPAPLGELTAEMLDRHYAINLRAPALLCRAFYERHDGRVGGRIVNLTSGQGLGPMPNQPAYAATKGGLEALTITLAPTVAVKNITINAVDPGPTDTGWMDEETYAAILRKSPLGRVGLPSDAANLVRFLVSAEGGWITGQVIRSRGGY